MVNSSTANLGASVVPDLMRVYESLTQSKTPQQQAQEVGSSSLRSSSIHETSNALPEPLNHEALGPNKQNLDHFPTDSALCQQLSHYQYDLLSQGGAAIPPSSPVATSNAAQAMHPAVQDLPPVSSADDSITSTKKTRPRRQVSRKRAPEPEKHLSDDSSKPKRKKAGGDGRWSKRFAWPDELHRDFVSAVFDVGLKHSSPSAVLEQMPVHQQITTERIKSHLQKYRLHRQKSKKEFMSSFETTMLKIKAGENDYDPTTLNCGEVAAHLAHTAINEKDVPGLDSTSLVQGGILQLPQLTEDEKQSPVGASMGYLMGLFFSLKQQLHAQRCAQGQIADGSAIIPVISPSGILIEQAHSIAPTSDQVTRLEGDAMEFYTPGSPPEHFHQFESSLESEQTSQLQSHQQFQQGHQAQHTIPSTANATATSAPVSSMPPPDARNNTPMEESNIMKRDMQSQMAFQNKMRKLKEQELSKYTQAAEAPSDGLGTLPKGSIPGHLGDNIQTAGASTDGALKSYSDALEIGGTDFWTSDEVLDDQLFEFLMNDED
jgi:SHAQKYF class myb-like DNA-binding protein